MEVANHSPSYRVIHSLMPKGVEHSFAATIEQPARLVIHSLMPKGVEHSARGKRQDAQLLGDSFVDAERR